MINIQLSEHSVFTHSAKTNSIGIWDHRDGKWSGPCIGQIGNIVFCDRWQVEHMHEMLEMLLEKGEWAKEENRLAILKYKDGEPCKHPGCAGHTLHPCEICGRIGARGEALVSE